MSSAIAPLTDVGSISGAAKWGPRTGGGDTNVGGDLLASAVPRPDNDSMTSARRAGWFKCGQQLASRERAWFKPAVRRVTLSGWRAGLVKPWVTLFGMSRRCCEAEQVRVP